MTLTNGINILSVTGMNGILEQRLTVKSMLYTVSVSFKKGSIIDLGRYYMYAKRFRFHNGWPSVKNRSTKTSL